jgi:hypothetical protein
MLLTGVHKMGASLLNMPEFALQPDEAKALSDSIHEVSKHYNFGIDPKKVALTQFALVLGGIYLPRTVMIFRATPKAKPKVVEMPRRETPVESKETTPTAPATLPKLSPLDAALLANTMAGGESEN